MLEWLGTFNASQWQRLHDFLADRLESVPARLQSLEAQQGRLGTLTMVFDTDGTPTGYEASPSDSYLGKLFRAYLALGGDPTFDLQLRPLDAPVFLLKTDEVTVPQRMSNGEIMGTQGLGDGESAEAIRFLRRPFERDIKARDALERKIRRAQDACDQLGSDIALLRLFVQGAEVAGSFANLASQIEALLDDPDYRAIYRDGGKDAHGRNTHAPYAGYEPGPDRPGVDQVLRTSKGIVEPGDT